MCIVLAPLAVAGITAAMTAASVAMQQVAASKEHAAAVTRSNLETDVANQSALRQYGALGRRESEESAQAANEITKITRESENASGQFSVEAAAGNVAGQSVDL